MNKMKLALEAVVLFIHLITGAFIGYIQSINETQVVITASIILYVLTMFILWGIARLKGKYIFFEVESVLHGAIIGVIITIPVIVLNWKAVRKQVSHNHLEARLPELANRFLNKLNSSIFKDTFLARYGYTVICPMFN